MVVVVVVVVKGKLMQPLPTMIKCTLSPVVVEKMGKKRREIKLVNYVIVPLSHFHLSSPISPSIIPFPPFKVSSSLSPSLVLPLSSPPLSLHLLSLYY